MFPLKNVKWKGSKWRYFASDLLCNSYYIKMIANSFCAYWDCVGMFKAHLFQKRGAVTSWKIYSIILSYFDCVKYHLFLYFQERYAMERGGRAIIVNMNKFSDSKKHEREGSLKDVENLTNLLESFQFNVDPWRDYTYQVNRKPMSIVTIIYNNFFLSSPPWVRLSVWLYIIISLYLS